MIKQIWVPNPGSSRTEAVFHRIMLSPVVLLGSSLSSVLMQLKYFGALSSNGSCVTEGGKNNKLIQKAQCSLYKRCAPWQPEASKIYLYPPSAQACSRCYLFSYITQIWKVETCWFLLRKKNNVTYFFKHHQDLYTVARFYAMQNNHIYDWLLYCSSNGLISKMFGWKTKESP